MLAVIIIILLINPDTQRVPRKVHFIYCSIITVLWISALSTIPLEVED